jgi:membrane associated rhomboid family serine protease
VNILAEIKASFKNGSSLTRLIYVNLAVFIAIQLSLIVLHLAGNAGFIDQVVRWLAVPADLPALLRRPWTLVSYMFTHRDFLHILFNLLWLFWFGKIFLGYLTQKQLFSVYILGGIAGAVLYILSYNVFPGLTVDVPGSVAIGASASVMAVVIAIATLVPSYKIYVVFIGPVKIIYVALISFVLSSVLDFSVNTGGKIAHIGGALFGYIFTLRLQKGRDLTMGFARLTDMLVYFLRPRRRKLRVTHKKPMSDYDYNREKAQRQKEVDRILDKISKSGYDSLTSEEKEMLFKMGK